MKNSCHIAKPRDFYGVSHISMLDPNFLGIFPDECLYHPATELVIPKTFSVVRGEILNPLSQRAKEPKMLSCAFVDWEGKKYTSPLNAEKILIYVGWTNENKETRLVSLDKAKDILGNMCVRETENAFLVQIKPFQIGFIVPTRVLERDDGSLINPLMDSEGRIRFPCLFCVGPVFGSDVRVHSSIKEAIWKNCNSDTSPFSSEYLYIYPGWDDFLKTWEDGFTYHYSESSIYGGEKYSLAPGIGRFKIMQPRRRGAK